MTDKSALMLSSKDRGFGQHKGLIKRSSDTDQNADDERS